MFELGFEMGKKLAELSEAAQVTLEGPGKGTAKKAESLRVTHCTVERLESGWSSHQELSHPSKQFGLHLVDDRSHLAV